MKKHLLFLLAFMPMVLFTACSSSDDEGNNSIIGTWVGYDRLYESIEEIYYPDGKYTETVISKSSGQITETIGRYSINGNLITYTYDKYRIFDKNTNTWGDYSDVSEEPSTIRFQIENDKLSFLNEAGNKFLELIRKK